MATEEVQEGSSSLTDIPERFYYDGVFYNSHEECNLAAYRFNTSEISPLSTERILSEMTRCISVNILMEFLRKNIDNGQLRGICHDVLLKFIELHQKALESDGEK